MRGDGVHGLAADVARSSMIHVAEAQHSGHAPLAVDHRKTADLLHLHDAGRVLEILLVEAEDDPFCHHLARGCDLRIKPGCDAAADNVPIRDHADEVFSPMGIAPRACSDRPTSRPYAWL